MLIKTALSLASPGGSNGKLSIFIYHRVLPQPDPIFPDEPCTARFDEMMEWVAGWFNVLPLEEAVERLRQGQLPARAAAITFDDGYADNLLYATPILKKHGLHACFFIATGFLDGGIMWNDALIESIRTATPSQLDLGFLGLGSLAITTHREKRQAIEATLAVIKHRPSAEREEAVARIREICAGMVPQDLMLTSAQVTELRLCGMGIGAHTVNHPILVKQTSNLARQEIADGKDFLEGLLKERIHIFAYPNGKLNRDYAVTHALIAQQLGFIAAVTTNWGVCSSRSNPYQLPRFTPWDQSKWRFGLRTLTNYRQEDAALLG